MAIETIPNKLEGEKSNTDFKYRKKQVVSIQFNYRQLLRLYLNYRHHVINHINHLHEPIIIKKTWAKKYWADQNFVLYLSVSAVNENLVAGQFKRNGEVE